MRYDGAAGGGFVAHRVRKIPILAAGALIGALSLLILPVSTPEPAHAADVAANANVPAATDVRLAGDDRQTRLIFDLTDKVDLSVFTLASPYRVIVDLPQVAFRLPAKSGDTGRGLIKAFRYGLIMQGGARVVIDTKGPVRVEKAFVLPAADGLPARMVLDLAATDRDSFMRDLAMANRQRAEQRRAEPPPATIRSAGDPRPLIVIDPGHGGIDTGTKAGAVVEKAIVLDFATMLRDRMEKSGKYRVAMTRTDDTFIPLAGRVKFARQRQAALFISIHADALPKGEGEAEGATVYTLSEKASDAQAARLAEAENRADVISGVDLAAEPNDVADILIDLAQRETKTFSAKFAAGLVNEMKRVARMHKHPMKSAGFRVLLAPDVPSVLLELGYVSTKDDLKQLMSEAWRARTADSIVQAVDSFFATRLAGANGGN
jgi:N-acetylmuramoyl-L-alanine amidase